MVKKIVIVGGGSSGWMTAAHLATHLQDIEISLIESSDIPVIGVGESTVPPMVDYMQGLGVLEEEWMPRCNATYKSSICFSEFHAKGDPLFWYPFMGRKRVRSALKSVWGRLFAQWGRVETTATGYVGINSESKGLVRGVFGLLGIGAKILLTCIREAPELAARKRRKRVSS